MQYSVPILHLHSDSDALTKIIEKMELPLFSNTQAVQLEVSSVTIFSNSSKSLTNRQTSRQTGRITEMVEEPEKREEMEMKRVAGQSMFFVTSADAVFTVS
eukprot:g49786.t1